MLLKERHGKYSAECFYTDADTGKRKRVLRATGIRVDGNEESRRTAEHRGRELEAELNGARGAARARQRLGTRATTLQLATAKAVEASRRAGNSHHTERILKDCAVRILHFFGLGRDPWTITAEELEAYAAHALARRATGTVKLELYTLRCMFQAAKVPLPKFPRVGGAKPRELAFDADELKLLLAFVPEGRDWPLNWPSRRDYLVMYASLGLSYSELYGIDPTGIDWAKRIVRVRGTKRATRDRPMPMSPTVAAVLRRVSELMVRRRDGVLFPRWRNSLLHGVLCAAAQNAGLIKESEKCSTNVLRASFCTQLVRANVHPKKIALLMGHSGTATANKWYARLNVDKDLHDAIAELPEF